MLGYHFKSALRYILKFRSHTVYSLLGLVVGLACVFIISAWTVQELHFDRFHKQAKHIYMITTDIRDNTGNVSPFAETPAPLAEALEDQIPQIERGFHFLYLYGGRSIGTESIQFKEAGLAATPAFLEVFNFKLQSGMASELDEPNTVFLSESLAEKIFPEGNALRKELIYRDSILLIVKGIFKDVPLNSSLQFDFLISYGTEYGISDNWWQLSDATFIKTAPSADVEVLHSLMKQVWRARIADEQFNIGLIPITDLRYGADFEFFNAEHGHGDRKKLYMFMGVAMLILILACLNYLNLVSAHTIKREHEIWIRRVNGASASAISGHFIMESVLLSILAWGLAILLSMLGLRLFERMMGVLITHHYFYLIIALGFPVAVFIVGLASGFYPALRAGSNILLSSGASSKPNFLFQRSLRKVFVMSQFVLSIGLVVSSMIIFRQANFMKGFSTGYSKEGVVDFLIKSGQDQVLNEVSDYLNANPDVEGYSFAGKSPISLTFLNTMEKWQWEGLQEGTHTSLYHLSVDEEYLKVFQIPVTEGRFFSSLGTNQNSVVINETLAAITGFENPVGHILRRGEEEYEIIGVVRDFNFQHLTNEIRPLLFMHGVSGRHLFVRIGSNAAEAAGHIQEQISSMTDSPVSYAYVSEEYDNLYKGEEQILSAILFFTVLSILLSSLGLIGVVSHGTEEKTKEIALRKVFGAETREMMITLNLSILKIFIPGFFLGSIFAWLVMREWLMDYVYRRGIEVWVFLFGSFIILVVALLSVSIQTWQAAKQSPAAALKNL